MSHRMHPEEQAAILVNFFKTKNQNDENYSQQNAVADALQYTKDRMLGFIPESDEMKYWQDVKTNIENYSMVAPKLLVDVFFARKAFNKRFTY